MLMTSEILRWVLGIHLPNCTALQSEDTILRNSLHDKLNCHTFWIIYQITSQRLGSESFITTAVNAESINQSPLL
jgi:hypothetical protein